MIYITKRNQNNEKEAIVKHENEVHSSKEAILEKIKIIKSLELKLAHLVENKNTLEIKLQMKSDDQIMFENLLEKEENLKRVLAERENTIAINEKNINDLRNKLQVN